MHFHYGMLSGHYVMLSGHYVLISHIFLVSTSANLSHCTNSFRVLLSPTIHTPLLSIGVCAVGKCYFSPVQHHNNVMHFHYGMLSGHYVMLSGHYVLISHIFLVSTNTNLSHCTNSSRVLLSPTKTGWGFFFNINQEREELYRHRQSVCACACV